MGSWDARPCLFLVCSAQDPRVSSAVTPAQHRKNTADGLPATGMDSTATEYHEIDCLVRVSPKAQGALFVLCALFR